MNGLLIAGIFILAVALVPVLKLTRELPPGRTRSLWKVLTLLILFFIAGYIGYVFIGWKDRGGFSELLVPGVFLGGAVFVHLVCFLSHKTVLELRRMHILEQENISDPLMGIFNRRYLDRRLHEEFLRAQRYHLPLSLLLLDVDHFKKINDTYGHQTGDTVLQKLGQRILRTARDIDIVARYGGEEVAVIMPNTLYPDAVALAERLRREIAGREIVAAEENGGQAAIHITASIGVSGFSRGQRVDDLAGLIRNADRALYQAKNGGRNRVIAISADN
jgi:diguanylate cyclase (GGDEF)-like protein